MKYQNDDQKNMMIPMVPKSHLTLKENEKRKDQAPLKILCFLYIFKVCSQYIIIFIT